MKPMGLRNRLTIVLALGTALSLVALTGGFNVLLRSSLDADADRLLRSAAGSGFETVQVRPNGTLHLLEPPRSEEGGSRIWVYSGTRALERPREPAPVQALADGLARSDGVLAESAEFDLRLLSLAANDEGGSQVGTIVAAVSLEPYERTAKRALVASLVFAGLVFFGVVAVGRLLLARALRPVSRMTREATDWSEHDLDHRFGVGEPHDELTGLASAFDSMLDRLASSLRHEQRLSAEISHELRTPLAAILAETELALDDRATAATQLAALERIRERSGQLETILETLLAAARAESGTMPWSCDAAAVVARTVSELEGMALQSGVRLAVAAAPGQALADVDPELLARMLAPLIENACGYGSSNVTVAIEPRGQRLEISVTDDGPGLIAGEHERIFEPGVRGSAASAGTAGTGAGLGLALVRRLAKASGGDARAESGPEGRGARFVLTLPASGHPR